jgi:hypothetical protein
VRIYGQDYVKRLAFVGFNVLKINPFEKYDRWYSGERFGLNPKESIFLAIK